MPDSEGIYRVRVRATPDRQDRYGDYTHWGGADVSIDLDDGDDGGFYGWLACGDKFIKRLHVATGEYLAKKALNAGD